ncbi:hypothetical protein FQN54_009134 [Arachnomyces sp. PD_36]|nr:hypothetical protein FQN54_009134 [Arachnomyces sp. PD_36]
MKRQYLPIETLPVWAKLNNVIFNGVEVKHQYSDDGSDKGSGVVVTSEKLILDGEGTGDAECDDARQPGVLISVPPDLVLSLDLVETCAKSDRYLREVLEAVGEYGRTARGAILIFLLLHFTYSSQEIDEREGRQRIGVKHPWSEYIKFLPASIYLPTFYNEEERELLHGTSLESALDAKMNSLEKEYGHLWESTQNIPWCQRDWWDEETGCLSFDDWKYVDAVYRSRALDLPGTGHAMVPCVDMANHASGDPTMALYDTDPQGNAALSLRDGKEKSLAVGGEITITYGDEKGAAEMIFSYGFLESDIEDARQLFLDLDIPNDDPLKPAKKMFCDDAPGLRLFTKPGSNATGWESDFVWWSCVNEEDGLDFSVVQSNDGKKELLVTWKGEEIKSSERLKGLLSTDPLWDLFQLRAVVLVQGRIDSQYSEMREVDEYVHHERTRSRNDESDSGHREEVLDAVVRLRKLEADLLQRGIADLEQKKSELLNSECVSAFLTAQSTDTNAGSATAIAEDFS